MQDSTDIETKLQELKPMLADRFHVSKIGYFGSYVNGSQTHTSDLDLVVEFSEPIGWGFFTLEGFLEKEFGIKIDLVTKESLKESFKTQILNQIKYI